MMCESSEATAADRENAPLHKNLLHVVEAFACTAPSAVVAYFTAVVM